MGLLFIITQQVQPSLSMHVMQSQQAWIISPHLASPLVQVMTQPLSFMSILHMPIVRLQQQTIMPFIITQQEHMPPASMVQRFCIMLHAIGSSQVQVIFMPPVHFSILIVARGTIIQFVVCGIAPAAIGVPMPDAAMPVMLVRSTIIVPVFMTHLRSVRISDRASRDDRTVLDGLGKKDTRPERRFQAFF
jgi:hypothetical protein